MRIVFPLAIVAIIARIGPFAALVMAATDPDDYSRVLTSAHVSVSAFGGAFLAMVGLKHFFDHEKDVHWIAVIERPLDAPRPDRGGGARAGAAAALRGFQLGCPGTSRSEFLVAGIFGLVTYIAVDGISARARPWSRRSPAQWCAPAPAAFLYLEVLDASFSFDGVIGAFALSNNLFIIAIGLGIGAMFVRSLTIMLVEQGTLTEYRYLEHGAFYAIIALAVIMFLKTVMHIPEVVTGLIGAGFIVTAFVDSIRYNRRAGASEPVAVPVASNGEIVKIQSLQESSRRPIREPPETTRPESRLK